MYANSGKLLSLLKCPSITFCKPEFNKHEMVFPAASFDKCPFGPAILCFKEYGYLEYANIFGS